MTVDWRAIVRRELGAVTRNAADDEDIVEELAQHLAQRYDDAIASGLSPDRALNAAIDELRAEHGLRHELSDARRKAHGCPTPPSTGKGSIMEDLWKDIRYSLRLLARSPGFAAAALLTLALGIGATTAIFSVLDAVLLREAPLAESERLVMVWETDRASSTIREPASYPDFLDFQRRSQHFAQLGAFGAGEVNLTPNQGDPMRLASLIATHDFSSTIGIQPLLGRMFTSAEAQRGGPRVTLISERLWQRDFQRARDVIGQVIRLNEQPYTIIGVMPNESDFGVMQVLTLAAYSRGFADRDRASRVDVWLPLQENEQSMPRLTHPLFVIGRLKPGSTSALAQQEMTTIAADLERTYDVNEARGVFIEPVDDVLYKRVRPGLWLLLGAVVLVLLIACVNVANLLLARGTARLREVALRSALGAQRQRLARQFAVENIVLTLGAAALGVLLAFGGLRALIAIAPPDVPRLAEAGLNLRLLGSAVALSIVIGFVFGMLPILQARRLDIQGALKAEDSRGAIGGRGNQLARSMFVVAEVALALVLVVGAGLLLRSFWSVQSVDPGFDASKVVKAEFQLPRWRYPVNFDVWPNFVEMHRFNADLRRRAEALPGVESVAIAGNHPLDAGFTNSFAIVGREAESRNYPEITVRRVTGSYFSTVRLSVQRGEVFGEVESQGPTVAAINETAARAFFGNRDPIGQQISFWGAARTILGVVGDEKMHGLTAATPPAIYVPIQQAPSADGAHTLLVRVRGNPAAAVPTVRAVVREADAGLAVFGAESLEETLSSSIQQRRFVMLLLGLFAGLAVVLAVIGIHGVLSYTVRRRQHEIGIRMALGASPNRVTRLVLNYGARLAALGIVLGIAVALVVTRFLATLLYGVTTTDAATLGGAVVLLAAAALLATYLPVRRAVRIDPMDSVREL
ncbi:MAG: ADOP family duplicated permease [Gemmatimonadaceae bacterium]